MNLLKYKELEEKGLIRYENRQIENITLRCNGHWKTMDCIVRLKQVEGREWHNEFKIPVDRILNFVAIFAPDDDPVYESNWDLSDFNGKYIRLGWYQTPNDEMHELADEEYLYAVRHIIENDRSFIFFMEPDKKGK